MWRLILCIALVGLGIGAMTKYNRTRSSTAASAGEALSSQNYVEARVVITAGNREIEFVAIGDHPAASDCDVASPRYEVPALCQREMKCQITKVECSKDIGQRYKNMLAKQPATTHYAHFAAKAGVPEKNEVLVAWGLTEQESLMVCQNLVRSDAAKSAGTRVGTCI